MPCPEDFDEFVAVQQVTETTDGAGGYSESWATRVSIWCMVEEIAGGEGVVAGRLEHSNSYRLTTHYDATISESDRVLLDGVEHKITNIVNLDRRDEYMTIDIETGRT